MKTALLLIAHGSRNVEANDDLHALAKELRDTGQYAPVEAAFLEIAEPTIEMAGVLQASSRRHRSRTSRAYRVDRAKHGGYSGLEQ